MADDDNVLAFPQAPEAIELRHLRAFVAVAEELNFGRAAERLYITQPALSRQIRSLEQMLGCELLRRSTHRVELTLAGEALLDRVRPVLREVDATVSTVQSLGGELVARVAKLWEPLVQAYAADADVQEQRMAYEKLLANFSVPPGDDRPTGDRERRFLPGGRAGAGRPADAAPPPRRRLHPSARHSDTARSPAPWRWRRTPACSSPTTGWPRSIPSRRPSRTPCPPTAGCSTVAPTLAT